MAEEGNVFMALAALSAAKLGLSWLTQRSRNSKKELVGYVTKLYIYPIKSCCGVSLESAQAVHYGMASGNFQDRSWLITDENYSFITARKYPRIQLIRPTIVGDALHLEAPGMDMIKLPLREVADLKKVHLCRIWSQKSEGMDCGDEMAEWLSKYLEVRVRLVQTTSSLKKRVLIEEPEFGYLFLRGTEVNFPDLSPVNMLSEASVEALKTKVETDISVRNFRPNIVIGGCDPHSEDTWDKVFIGDVQFSGVKLCSRCIMTTINPDLGQKDPGGQPLKTMRTYRQKPELGYGSEVVFSADFAIDRQGTIKVGDPVYALIGSGLSIRAA